jgi:hypothetical protein
MKHIISVIFLITIINTHAQVILKDTVITWHTFKYTLNDDNSIDSFSPEPFDTTSVKFNAYILENEYLKILLLPEYGGRILSLIYKPTGHEQLYRNPVGVPYGVGQDWFYYKWLMVYGGIFPTLTEPEHGKAWLLPWDFNVLHQSEDSIKCVMRWHDTVDFKGADPNKWKYGMTEIECDYTITLVKGSSVLKTEVELKNNKNETVEYEYWTCMTLAPGSDRNNPFCTDGLEIIVPADKIKIPTWYPDIARQEKQVTGQRGVYYFDKLRLWKNWVNDGIAYVWDDENLNYWGVINHDNEEGLIRVADNNITPGIKIWAWKYDDYENVNPFENPDNVKRPYVELWAGNSHEFFEPAILPAGSTLKWRETFFPTVNLNKITKANYNFILSLDTSDFYYDKGLEIKFVTSYPGDEHLVKVEAEGDTNYAVSDINVAPDPYKGSELSLIIPDDVLAKNIDSLRITVVNLGKNKSIDAALSVDKITSVKGNETAIANAFYLKQNYPNPFNPVTNIEYYIPEAGNVKIVVFDALGREAEIIYQGNQIEGKHIVSWNGSQYASGIYFYGIYYNGKSEIRKMILMK